VTRSTGGAPVILNVEGPGDVKFTVDLVPAFKFELKELKIACLELHQRVTDIVREHNIKEAGTEHFMAVALNKADKDSFEVHFPKLERGLLSRTGGCIRKVVMMMKYLRDTTGGTILKLWSHLLKTSVMNHALRNQTSPGGDYWNNKNLTKCFVDCMRNLWVGLQKQSIKDIFFPEFNMLDRLDHTILEQCCKWLDNLIKKHTSTESVTTFFPNMKVVGLEQRMANLSVSKDSNTSDDNLQCEACDKRFNGLESWEQHVRSEKHQKKVLLRVPLTKISGPGVTNAPNSTVAAKSLKTVQHLQCLPCQKTFSGQESLDEHLKSSKHQKKVCPIIPSESSKNANVKSAPVMSNGTKVEQEYGCKFCQISCSGPASYQEHLASAKHLKKVTAAAFGGSTASNGIIKCTVCSVEVSGEQNFKQHEESEKHKKKLLKL